MGFELGYIQPRLPSATTTPLALPMIYATKPLTADVRQGHNIKTAEEISVTSNSYYY